MRLSDYLTKHRLTLRAFGDKAGLSVSAVSRLNRGLRVGTWETIEKIEKATGGQVTVADLRPKKAA